MDGKPAQQMAEILRDTIENHLINSEDWTVTEVTGPAWGNYSFTARNDEDDVSVSVTVAANR